MIDPHFLHRKGRHVLFLSVVGIITAGLSYGDTIFYARDFLFTLQFKPGRDIVPDPSGTPMSIRTNGIYVAAAFQVAGFDFQGYLRKYDTSGKELWTRQVTGADGAFPSAVATDGMAVYLSGAVGFGHTELFVRKYDEVGNELWSRQLRITDGGYHLAAGMATDPSGLYVAAWDGRSVGLIRKYSASGDEIWSRQFAVRSLRGLALPDGLYIAGTNDQGGFVDKYTAAGDRVWTHQLTTSEMETVVPAGIAADSTGIYVGGSVYRRVNTTDLTYVPESGEAFLRRLDGSGQELWARRFGTSSSAGVVSLASDATGVYVGGQTQRSLPGQCKSGNSDVFVRKYDTSGDEVWTRQFGTSGFDFAGTMAVDSTGVYLSGGIRGGAAQGSLFVAKLGKTGPNTPQPGPQISSECVVNAASYAGGGVAPGEIVTIFGRAMGPPQLSPFRLAEDGRLATALADTRIFFNDKAAPLLYVSATQSSAIVPYTVNDNATVDVQVEYQGVRSERLTLPVLSSRPGVFAINGSGSGQGAILNEDGSLNSLEHPAQKGSTIALYITGEGLTDPTVMDGLILHGIQPKPRQPLSVYFEDPAEEGTVSPAEVVFAGGAPQQVAGLLQINVRVPSWTRSGVAVPIYVQVGSEYAEAGVTLAVR